jgi:hypothetical protein
LHHHHWLKLYILSFNNLALAAAVDSQVASEAAQDSLDQLATLVHHHSHSTLAVSQAVRN